MRMNDTGLDEISENFSLTNYIDINSHISIIQEEYIESRIKWFWRLPFIRQFTATKILLMHSAPKIDISGVEGEKFIIAFTQTAMVVGKSEFWSLLLLKRRK